MLEERKKRKLTKVREDWAQEQGFAVSQCGRSCRRCNGPRCPYYTPEVQDHGLCETCASDPQLQTAKNKA